MYAIVHSLSVAVWGMMPGVWAVMNRPSKPLFEIKIPDYDMRPTPQDCLQKYRRLDDDQKRARIASNIA